MLKFANIEQLEKARVPFVDAVTEKDTFNGAFGEVQDGVFKFGASKGMAIMQVECGDEAGMDKYVIPKGTKVRVIDLAKFDGEKLEVYGYPLPATVEKTNKLEAEADGSLKVNSGASGVHLVVEDFIGNKDGVLVTVHTK